MIKDIKAWVHFGSIYISDKVKSASWIIFDRRMTWLACRKTLPFDRAYRMLKGFEATRALLEKCRKEVETRKRNPFIA